MKPRRPDEIDPGSVPDEYREALSPLPDPVIVVRIDGTFTARSRSRGREAHGKTREEALAALG